MAKLKSISVRKGSLTIETDHGGSTLVSKTDVTEDWVDMARGLEAAIRIHNSPLNSNAPDASEAPKQETKAKAPTKGK